jgi:hypothetical protein
LPRAQTRSGFQRGEAAALPVGRYDLIKMNRADFVTESRPLPFGRRAQLVLKRGFDLVVAAGALVLLSPLIALILLAIKLDRMFPPRREARCLFTGG